MTLAAHCPIFVHAPDVLALRAITHFQEKQTLICFCFIFVR